MRSFFKRTFLIFTSLLFLCAFRPHQESAKIVKPPNVVGESNFNYEEEDFTIATWNIEWFPAKPKTSSKKTGQRIKKVSEFIQKQNPTILFACEIRDLESLQRLKLSYPSIACANFTPKNPKDPNLGLALMSKILWEEIWLLDFSDFVHSDSTPPRGILGAEFILPSGEKLTLYGVHLKSNKEGYTSSVKRKRERAMHYLYKDWKRRKLNPKKDNIIILGDFNTSLSDPAFRSESTLNNLIDLSFFSSLDGEHYSNRSTIVPLKNKPRGSEFDHIFFSPALKSKLKGLPPWGEVLRVPRFLSDHYFLVMKANEWWN